MSSQIMYDAKKCISCGACMEVCQSNAHTFLEGEHGYNRQFCTECGKCSAVCCTQALSVAGKQMCVDEVIAEILKDELFYHESGGGVTLSGGEPLFQADFSIELLRRVKKMGISSCVETCGLAEASKLLEAAEFTDLFYFDYKATGDELHKRLCGAAQSPILHNLARLDEIHAKVVLRCPIVPGANACEEHILGIARTALQYECICEVQLEPFHRLGLSKAEKLGLHKMYDAEPPARSIMELYCKRIEELSGKRCFIS